jgi:hypothetical protein
LLNLFFSNYTGELCVISLRRENTKEKGEVPFQDQKHTQKRTTQNLKQSPAASQLNKRYNGQGK